MSETWGIGVIRIRPIHKGFISIVDVARGYLLDLELERDPNAVCAKGADCNVRPL